MPEPEAGTVTSEQAALLLLVEDGAELKRLEREGAFTPISPGRYWIKDLVQGFVRYTRKTRFMTDTNTLANCLGISAARIGQLEREGWFKSVARNKWIWTEVCAGFVKYLRDMDRRATKSSADSRIKDAKTRDIEVRTAQRLGRLVPLEDYEAMIDTIAGMVRSEFAGLPAAVTRDLALRRIIEREVNARLKRIAEAAMAQTIRLGAAGGDIDAVAADGAGRLGGSEQDISGNGSGAGAA